MDKYDFDNLPDKNGEEDGSWQTAMARYGHLGCPGIQMEDVCSEPWTCASKGMCRIHYEKHVVPWLKNSRREVKDVHTS